MVVDIVGTSRLIALHKHLVRVCLTFLLGMYAGALWASTASNVVTTEHISAQLVAEHQELTPGKTSSIALKLNHHPQWHSYWRTPGDSGLPTQIKWNVPAGIKMGAIQWPAPKRIPFGPLMNFGYEGETWLISDITLPPDFAKPSVTLSGHVEWLVCNDVCIPEEGLLTLTLPVALPGTSPIANPEAVRGFETVRTLLPKEAKDWGFTAVSTSAGSTLSIVPPQGQSFPQSVSFFPYDEGVIEPSAAQTLSHDGAGYQLSITRAVQPVAPLVRLRGIVVTENGTASPEALEIDIPVPGAGAAKSDTSLDASAQLSLIAAVLLALSGGVLLNLMPCVFPILSMKVFAFAREADPYKSRRNGLFYSIGVVISFWLLAIVLMGLRSAGHEFGWGFQLQSPVIVASLALLFFVLALNLLDVFEMGSLVPSPLASISPRHPDVSAFFSGVLAVAVASPCTGPFMAVALGYAVTQPGWTSLAVFTSLGIGMALPYFLLAWFSGIRKWLPRPGLWMVQLRQFLAFPLLATVIWLAWVLGVQAGVSPLIDLLLALWLIGLGLWFFGRFPSRLGKTVSWALALSILIPMANIAGSATSELTPQAGKWEAYSQAKVEQRLGNGKTVFVDFTAAWCVTCQVNKKLVLNSDEIDQAFEQSGVVRMRADWTNRDPEITRALAHYGRSAVPMYLVLRPGQSPELLPELLTKSLVKAALASPVPPSNESSKPILGTL